MRWRTSPMLRTPSWACCPSKSPRWPCSIRRAATSRTRRPIKRRPARAHGGRRHAARRRSRPRSSIHRRKQGQRLDHLAAFYIKDVYGFWRIAELNNVMLPEALSEALFIIPDGAVMGFGAIIASGTGNAPLSADIADCLIEGAD